VPILFNNELHIEYFTNGFECVLNELKSQTNYYEAVMRGKEMILDKKTHC